MTPGKRNTESSIRLPGIILAAGLLLLLPSLYSFSQNGSNGLIISFAKTTDSLSSTQLYFNVLRIINTSQRTVAGDLFISGPDGWKIISSPAGKQFINPGDTIRIPVRVAPSPKAVGGIAYVINATLKTNTSYYTANSYIILPSRPKWDFSTPLTSIYFTEYSPDAAMEVILSNRGNTNEIIKLQLQTGRLLLLDKSRDPDYSEYINLPAFTDTTLSYTFVYNTDLNPSDISRFENNWRESAVVVTASTESEKKSSTVSIRKLKSEFINSRNQASSPLNLDLQIYNLMSNQRARMNFKTYGTVLFPKKRDVQYLVGVQSVYFDEDGNKNFDVDRQLVYSVRYTDERNRIHASYNITGGELHTINGRGIDGTFRINRMNSINYTFVQNPFSRTLGASLGYTTHIKGVTLNTSVTQENTSDKGYGATSFLAGAGFSFLRYHTVSLSFLGSLSKYNNMNGTDRDTSVFGYSYRVFYNLKYKKIDLRINAMNAMGNYIRYSGMQQVYLDGRYALTDKVRFNLYGNRQYYALSKYPYNFFNPVSYNSNDYLRLTASLSRNTVLYQIGPTYTGSMRQFNDPVMGFGSSYKTWQPGVWGSVTFKLKGNRTISPNITVTDLIFDYQSEDPDNPGYSRPDNIYYTAGISYYDNVWKVNAYYSNGTTTDLYRSLQIDEKPVLTRSIQVRPAYEKYFFERRVKLSAYVNYAYYMPSGRENISYSLRYDHFLRNGWSFNLNGFMYSNTRVTEDHGRVNAKDVNLIAGLVKSFELQQPRQKYYDFRAVFFNDLDGDNVKSENEPPVPNILVNIEKDKLLSKVPGSIASVDLLSDARGEIFFENLPMDYYRLTFTPLVNLQSLYFLNGDEQSVYNDQKKIIYIPLAESYKIKGKVIVVRDPNSTEGRITLSGIRVTALGASGETYSALTDKFGNYTVNVPKGDRFKVRVNNIFGEQFSIDADEIEVQFSANKTINVDFTFVEKRREIRFNNGEDFSRVTSGRGASARQYP